MDKALDRFVADLVEPFLDGDLDQVANAFDEPIILVRPNGSEVFDTRADYAAECRRVRDAYTGSGLAGVRHEILDRRTFAPGLVSVDVRWRYVNTNGLEMAELYTTYVLRARGDSFSIVTHISHNEIFSRPGTHANPVDAGTEPAPAIRIRRD